MAGYVEKSSENNNNEKYTYVYMGFGNGLSIDNSIYEEFKPYLLEEVNKVKESHGDTGDNPSFNYPAWEPAFLRGDRIFRCSSLSFS